ncbi:YwqJ-related putative deaminase [Streptomyces sp. NPDC055099]
MIDPAKIPQFTGDLDQLSHHIGGLRRAAEGIRMGGSTAHSQFQTLAAVYSAPEAEDLFASTAPVRDGADTYANKVVTVAEALAEYASTVKPIAERLKRLQAQAVDFLNDVRGDDGKIDDDWRKDESKHNEYTTLYNDIAEAEAAFQIAEVAANNKITALVDGTQYVMETGGNMLRPIGAKTYGYTADVLKQMEKLPWGTPETRKREGLEWVSYQVTSFTEGFLVDGGWETVKGLATLAGFNGSDAQGQAWKGLGLLATGVAFSTMPGVSNKYWQTPANKLPPLMRDSRRAVTETGKALVAYDMWSKNPARAGGTVSFNVITTVFTGGAGAAAKGGTAARAAAIAGKGARLIDPATYVVKGTKFTAVTIRDTFAHLKNGRGTVNLEMPVGAYRLPEQASTLPERAAGVPEDAVRYADPDGNAIYLHPITHDLLDEHGKVIQRSDEVTAEGTAAERAGAQAEMPSVHDPLREPVMAGARAGDGAGAAAGRAGDGSDGAGRAVSGGAENHAPGGRAHDSGGGSAAGHESPGGAPHGHSGPGSDTVDGARRGSAGHGPTERSGGDHGANSTAENGSHYPNHSGPHDGAPHTSPIHPPYYDENPRGIGYHSDGESVPKGDPVADHLRTDLDDAPAPGLSEKSLIRLPEARITRTNGLITHVDGRPVEDYLKDLSYERGAAYRNAKADGTLGRKTVGACVGSVIDLRTGEVIEGVNGKARDVISAENLHPTLAQRLHSIPNVHPDNPLGHAEVKAANELLWQRTRKGLPDGEGALAELSASVELPYVRHPLTGAPGRPAPFCANCLHMLEGVDSTYGRHPDYPPSDETWIP